jgi:hypothetical protein
MADVIRKTANNVHVRVKIPVEQWRHLVAINKGEAYACRALRLALDAVVEDIVRDTSAPDPNRDLTH